MHALETQKPIAALAQSFDWSDLTKRSALTTPKKGVIFHVENQCHMQGAPIVLSWAHSWFYKFYWRRHFQWQGLDPVFQEVMWPNGWGVGLRNQRLQVRGPARIIEWPLEEVIALCSRAAEACSVASRNLSACLFAWIMTGAPTRLHQLDDRGAL